MKVKVAAIQMQAYDVAQAADALTTSLKLISQAAEQGPDLIVLPECTYPGYFLGHHGDIAGVLSGLDDAIKAYADKAAEYQVHLIVGAPKVVNNKIYNAAYLFGPDGKIINCAAKAFLWHFDSKWFSAADSYKVIDTAIGKIGMIVCADGRQPEISRILALNGAQIIVDVTNWVTSGNERKALSNPQYEYIIPTRAMENQVWFVAANKVGMEAESIVYCGRSCIISPTGNVVATASSYEETIVTAQIDIEQSKKTILPDRQPNTYGILTHSTDTLPITTVLREKICPREAVVYASAVQMAEDASVDQYMEEFDKIVSLLALQRSRLIVFPELSCLYSEKHSAAVISWVTALSKKFNIFIVVNTVLVLERQNRKVAILVEPTGIIHRYIKTHLSKEELNHYLPGQDLPVFKTSIGNIGLMLGSEGFLPEVARVLMLNGADIICWPTSHADNNHQMVTRTRAAENRLNIIVSNTWGKETCGQSLMVNVNGAVVASAFSNSNQMVSAFLDLAAARQKTVVPGTDIVENRIPNSYTRLLEV